MVKYLPCNAGDADSIPSERTKFPHAPRQTSPYNKDLVQPKNNNNNNSIILQKVLL